MGSLQIADRGSLIAADNLSARAIPASGRTVPVRTKPLKLRRLRGRAAIPMPASRLLSLRIATVVRRFPAPCGGVFPHVAETLSLATGNGAPVRHTQPHTRLKCLWVRSCHLPWNTALWCPLCGWARDRPGFDLQLLRGQENNEPLRVAQRQIGLNRRELRSRLGRGAQLVPLEPRAKPCAFGSRHHFHYRRRVHGLALFAIATAPRAVPRFEHDGKLGWAGTTDLAILTQCRITRSVRGVRRKEGMRSFVRGGTS